MDGGEQVLRAFVAVEIPDEVRAALAAEQARLKKLGAHVGWAAPETIHITLLFLGDIFGAQVAPLAAALDAVAAQHAPFELAVAGLGWFGPQNSPRVIWAGVSDPDGKLAALQRQIGEQARALGLRTEARPFHPHLTLGRTRPGGHAMLPALTAALRQANDTAYGQCVVDSVRLMQSRLEPAGARHSLLHAAVLKGISHG
ncbi:MAG: RNA 2',3'-cyclic phosphodiesterase [Kiritimatiellaeota bacterium]|nr:RNA 2',3'-cyclic phosphodiesterase [Kiritimatiellota bacterium]